MWRRRSPLGRGGERRGWRDETCSTFSSSPIVLRLHHLHHIPQEIWRRRNETLFPMHHCYLKQSQTKKYIFISINGDFFQHKGCQGVGLQCPMGLSNRVPGGQGVGPHGLRGQGCIYGIPLCHRVGLMSLLMIHKACMPVYK